MKTVIEMKLLFWSYALIYLKIGHEFKQQVQMTLDNDCYYQDAFFNLNEKMFHNDQ